MTEERLRVKDLAAELGTTPKDLLHILRELELPAKSAMTPIEPEDVPRVREAVQGKADSSVMRKETQSGVIVRRRQRDAAEPAAQPEKAAPAGETPPVPTGAAETGAPAKASVATPEAAKPAVSAPEETAAPEEKPAKAKTRRAVMETTPARVIHRPEAPAQPEQKEEPVAAALTAPAAPVVEAEAPVEPNPAPGARSARPARPDASAEPDAAPEPSILPPIGASSSAAAEDGFGFAAGDDEGDDTRGRRKKRPEPAPTPSVRIISRPDPTAAPAQEAGRGQDRAPARTPDRPGGYAPRPGAPRPASDRPGGFGDRPGYGQRPGGFAPRPGGFAQPAAPLPEESTQSKKKRMKAVKRTVDFADTTTRVDEEGFQRAGMRRNKRLKGRDARPAAVTQPLKAAKRKIRVEEVIRVADLAHQMGLKATEIIKVLFGLGVMATINKALDIETATVVASEFGYEVEKVGFAEEDYLIPKEADAPEALKTRPPVVTIMGHVDHGKTSLLDAIRKSHVTDGEAGGITQHIGAYHVETKKGAIVFLDTPGHEAFTAMRARGAQVTDLVVLVVAADDGVMEQTREAVNHSRAAGVPIMVAVNKIDKPNVNPDRVLRELAEIGLVAEAWGGDTIVSMVSAKTRQGLDDLLEILALQAEILELKANPDKLARGRIVEAKLDKGRGPVATVLIQEGTLHQGDTFVCGVFSGRVRALFDDQGKKVNEAGPSMPVEVQGFEGVPEAGEEFVSVADEKLARRIAASRAIKQREKELARESKVTLETFLARRADDKEALVLNLVVKADVQGSLEAILEALRKLSTDKVRINIIHGGAGAISESDILLASASDAIIIGFNVRPTAKVKDVADQEKVEIRFYDIIYKLVEEVKDAMEGMLAPVSKEVYLGQAEVRQTFSVPKIGTIAGCHVADGKIARNAGVRLLRDGVVIYTGKISSLKRFKDDVREVLKGYECGIGLENYNDVKNSDIIEAFEMVEEAATL